MNDLVPELQYRQRQLDRSIAELRVTGTKWAEADRDYYVVLSTECLRLRDEGMPIGLIDKVVRGLPSVAKARFDRHTADVIYKANNESINATKLQIKIVENQIAREWGNPKGSI